MRTPVQMFQFLRREFPRSQKQPKIRYSRVRCLRYKPPKKLTFCQIQQLSLPNRVTVGLNSNRNRLPLGTVLYSDNRQQLITTTSTVNVCRGTARRQRYHTIPILRSFHWLKITCLSQSAHNHSTFVSAYNVICV